MTVADIRITETLDKLSQIQDGGPLGYTLTPNLEVISKVRAYGRKAMDCALYYMDCFPVCFDLTSAKITVDRLKKVLLNNVQKTYEVLSQMGEMKLRCIGMGLRILQAAFAGTKYVAEEQIDEKGNKIPIFKKLSAQCLVEIIDIVEEIALSRMCARFIAQKKES